MFLERSTRNKTTDSNMNTTSDAAEEQNFSGDGEDVMRPPVSHAKKKKKLNAADEEFLSIIKQNLSSGNHPPSSNQMEQDDDKLFCLSLHKELIKVPEENRLQAKIELMEVLQTHQALRHKPFHKTPSAARSFHSSTQYTNQPPLYQGEITHRGQNIFQETAYNVIDPSTSSLIPAYSAYSAQRNAPSTASAYSNPRTPSSASTQDSQDSEMMELFDN